MKARFNTTTGGAPEAAPSTAIPEKTVSHRHTHMTIPLFDSATMKPVIAIEVCTIREVEFELGKVCLGELLHPGLSAVMRDFVERTVSQMPPVLRKAVSEASIEHSVKLNIEAVLSELLIRHFSGGCGDTGCGGCCNHIDPDNSPASVKLAVVLQQPIVTTFRKVSFDASVLEGVQLQVSTNAERTRTDIEFNFIGAGRYTLEKLIAEYEAKHGGQGGAS